MQFYSLLEGSEKDHPFWLLCLFFFSLLHQRADDETLTRLLLSVSGCLANPGQVDVFLLQVFPDIVHPDLPLPSSASLSLHVKRLLVVVLPPSIPHVQTT